MSNARKRSCYAYGGTRREYSVMNFCHVIEPLILVEVLYAIGLTENKYPGKVVRISQEKKRVISHQDGFADSAKLTRRWIWMFSLTHHVHLILQHRITIYLETRKTRLMARTLIHWGSANCICRDFFAERGRWNYKSTREIAKDWSAK